MDTKQDYFRLEFDQRSSTLIVSFTHFPGGVKWNKDLEDKQLEFLNSILPSQNKFFVIIDASMISKMSFEVLLFGLLDSIRTLQAIGLCFEAIVKPKGLNTFLLMNDFINDLDKQPMGIFESREEATKFINEEITIMARSTERAR